MIEELRNQLIKIDESNNPSKITNVRGRTIAKVKREIERLKQDENNKTQIKDFELFLEELIDKHKEQISSRYKEEFIRKEAKLRALVTVLPKGIVLSIRKLSTCIQELIQSKTNKEKLYNLKEVLKSLGLVAATPGIFTAKFVVKHWYIFLLLLGLKIPKLSQKGKDNKETESNDFEVQHQEEYVLEEQFKELKRRMFEREYPFISKKVPKWAEELPSEIVSKPNTQFEDILNDDFEFEYKSNLQMETIPNTNSELELNSNINEGLAKTEGPVLVLKPNTQMESIPSANSELELENIQADLETKMHINNLLEIFKYNFKTTVVGGDIKGIYNTYEDALSDFISQGLTMDEAVQHLKENQGSISWIIGSQENPGVFFNSQEEMIDFFKSDEYLGITFKNSSLEKYVESNYPMLLQLMEKQKQFGDFSSFIEYFKNNIGDMGKYAFQIVTILTLTYFGINYPVMQY